MNETKAVVLLSGGIDSSTTLVVAQSEGYQCAAISFEYGQRHKIEIESAKKITSSFNVEPHLIFPISLDKIGGSALTDNIEVPKGTSLGSIGEKIPITYVPARNTIFLSIALAWAEVIGARHIFIGANAVDYSGYPDCRPEFIKSFETTANLATKSAVEGRSIKIHAPLLKLSKAEIIRRGSELGIDYSMTVSCYDPTDEGLACRECDSCRLRRKGFLDAQIDDPTKYVAGGAN